ATFADEADDEAMNGFERCSIIDAKARQVIDVEEAAIVDIIRGQSPIGHEVMLPIEQMMKCEQRARVAGGRAIGGQPALDEPGGAGSACGLGLEGGRPRAGGAARATRAVG